MLCMREVEDKYAARLGTASSSGRAGVCSAAGQMGGEDAASVHADGRARVDNFDLSAYAQRGAAGGRRADYPSQGVYGVTQRTEAAKTAKAGGI